MVSNGRDRALGSWVGNKKLAFTGSKFMLDFFATATTATLDNENKNMALDNDFLKLT